MADEVLHASAKARSLDNLSVVFVAFRRFKEYIETMQHQEYLSPMQPGQAILMKAVTGNAADVSAKATNN